VNNAVQLALSPAVVRRATGYAVVVGTLLVAINHGDVLIGGGHLDGTRLLRMGLTVLVPYAVSTLSSVQALLAQPSSPS